MNFVKYLTNDKEKLLKALREKMNVRAVGVSGGIILDRDAYNNAQIRTCQTLSASTEPISIAKDTAYKQQNATTEKHKHRQWTAIR